MKPNVRHPIHNITSRLSFRSPGLHLAVKPRRFKAELNSIAVPKQITTDFAEIRSSYRRPRHAIVLAHGLLGFNELHIAGNLVPGVQYWRGITDAFRSRGIETITASVPASASIEMRGSKLAEIIEQRACGKSVNIVAHSMGGLDARYMISRLRPKTVTVKSLTTIATPHRGSAFADYAFQQIGERRLPSVYKFLKRISVETGAFSQLTRSYMHDKFNPSTPDDEAVKYFSYGAAVSPALWSAFRSSHKIIEKNEGPNDGLVSVASSQWGQYQGTLMEVSHLDLINWTNRLRWLVWEAMGNTRNFNAIALYLHIADMLADEGF